MSRLPVTDKVEEQQALLIVNLATQEMTMTKDSDEEWANSAKDLLVTLEAKRTHLIFGLQDGKPYIDLLHTDKNYHFNHTFETDICSDSWHTVHLLVTMKRISFELNTIRRKVDVEIPRVTMNLVRNLPVHIGGLPTKLAHQFGHTSIIGCVRGMSLSNKDVVFEDAKRLLKVVPGGCPYNA